MRKCRAKVSKFHQTFSHVKSKWELLNYILYNLKNVKNYFGNLYFGLSKGAFFPFSFAPEIYITNKTNILAVHFRFYLCEQHVCANHNTTMQYTTRRTPRHTTTHYNTPQHTTTPPHHTKDVTHHTHTHYDTDTTHHKP